MPPPALKDNNDKTTIIEGEALSSSNTLVNKLATSTPSLYMLRSRANQSQMVFVNQLANQHQSQYKDKQHCIYFLFSNNNEPLV